MWLCTPWSLVDLQKLSVLSYHAPDFDTAPEHFLSCHPHTPPGPAPNCPPPGRSLAGLSNLVPTQKKKGTLDLNVFFIGGQFANICNRGD